MAQILTLVILLVLLNYAAKRLGFSPLGVLRWIWSSARTVGHGLAQLGYHWPTALGRAIGALWGDWTRTVRCVNGCGRVLPTVAIVTCKACQYRSMRSLFAPCPACGSARRHVRCPHCRISLPRPLLWTQPQPPRHYS
jgi:hypothetical protein